ncbi:MAG: hypothetical protein A3K77_07330 [Euryarchaeota archaeon RBG_13_31_8]|nr:MAG: hypothetical protein A3K77_07330 [Euryarchaeota archaeon RBG_13_31_8]
MKITLKKIIVIFIMLVFVLPSITVSSSETIKISRSVENIGLKQPSCPKKCYTIYRFGLDGSITPIQVDIDVDESQYIGESIANKCEELFEKDSEMQSLIEIELENLTFGFLCKVKSHGRGLHYKSMMLEKAISRFVLFRLGFPRATTILHNTFIVCRYPKDIRAKTKITQFFGKNDTINKTMIVEGNHTVIVQNFIGYTTWLGRFSKTILNLVPRAFAGFARFVICNKLE